MRKCFASLILLASALLFGGWMDNTNAPVAAGYCSNSSLGSAVGLSSFTGTACNGVSAATLATYEYIVICAYNANVNWVDVGTATAAVGTGGQQIAQNQCIPYNGSNPASLSFIQQSSGAVVGVTLYKIP